MNEQEISTLEQQRNEAIQQDDTIQAVRFRENQAEREKERAEFLRENVSDAGSVPGISSLAEQRRLAFGIPDAYFLSQACGRMVNVFQIPAADDGDKYGGDSGLIHKAGWVADRELQSAPKGIIVSAGPEALDQMYTMGIWVGHIINFVAMNPWRKKVAMIGGQDEYVLTMTCGDITDSDDLARYRAFGHVDIGHRDIELDDGMHKREHFWQDTETKGVWDPSSVEALEDEVNA